MDKWRLAADWCGRLFVKKRLDWKAHNPKRRHVDGEEGQSPNKKGRPAHTHARTRTQHTHTGSRVAGSAANCPSSRQTSHSGRVHRWLWLSRHGRARRATTNERPTIPWGWLPMRMAQPAGQRANTRTLVLPLHKATVNSFKQRLMMNSTLRRTAPNIRRSHSQASLRLLTCPHHRKTETLCCQRAVDRSMGRLLLCQDFRGFSSSSLHGGHTQNLHSVRSIPHGAR